MRGSSLAPCRTQSLSAKRAPKKYQKVRPRVSFSLLPPAKIEFESENDYSEANCDKISTMDAKIKQLQMQKQGKQNVSRSNGSAKPLAECPKRDETMSGQMNDIDSVNEMLMDIIEEIEAENVTVRDCLRDAVTLKVLDADDAKSVLPDFTAETEALCLRPGGSLADFTNYEVSEEDSLESEQEPVDRLLDLFSTLKTEDLAKCCKYTLGKLCQLTSYENYAHVQQIAANAKNDLLAKTRLKLCNATNCNEEFSNVSSEYADDSSSIDTSCLSSSSSENLEYSSFDSDKDSAIDSDRTPVSNCLRAKSKPDTSVKTICDALPVLTDEGVLRPRQAWSIIGSGDSDEMLKRFVDEVSSTSGGKVLERFRRKLEKPSWFQAKEALNMSDNTSDLGYCSNQSESDVQPTLKPRTTFRRANIARKPGKTPSVNYLPFTISSARPKSNVVFPKTSTPAKRKATRDKSKFLNNEVPGQESKGEHVSLVHWCQEHQLPPSVAYVLHRKCQSEDDLLTLDTLDIENLTELPLAVRVRLWVAVESMKLDREYKMCKEKLALCAEALKSITS